MPSSIIGGRLPNGKYKEVSLDASGRLECSVDALEVSAETINLNTDTLETLQTSMSAKLTDIDNSVIASTNVVSKLNLIETTNNANEVLLTSCSAKLTDIDNTAGATATILRPYLIEGNVNTANIKSGVDSLSACCDGSEVQVDIVGGGFNGAVTNAHLTELGGAINSAKVDVNIVSGNISGFATSTLQGTANTELTAIKVALQSLDDIVQGEDASHGNAHKGVMSLAVRQDTQADFGGDGDYCPMSIDANGDLRVKIDDASKTHLSEIEGAIENIEGCVSGSELQVDIVAGGFNGAVTNSHLTELGGAINSAKVDVNIVSGNISGFATSTLQGTINTSLGTLETSLTSMEGKQNTQVTHLSEIEGAVETLEACVSSNVLAVNLNGGKTTTQMLYGSGNLIANGTPEASSNSVELKNNGSDYLQVFIEAQNGNWQGFLQFSYNNSTWFDDNTLNALGSPKVYQNGFKQGKYVRVKITNQHGTNGDTNSFVVHIVQ